MALSLVLASTIPSAVSAALSPRAFDDLASLRESQFLCDLSESTNASKLWAQHSCKGILPCPPMPCGEPLCPSVFSGIKCDISGHIALLNLSGQGLTGTLPNSIADIRNVQQILLQNNRLSGTIPRGLWSLPNLSTFRISQNMISGTIPPNVESLAVSAVASPLPSVCSLWQYSGWFAYDADEVGKKATLPATKKHPTA
eukprot:m51a1_g7995 putative leucine-rich repeat transmembrane protein kinase (199) ;mRNA; f:120971-122895